MPYVRKKGNSWYYQIRVVDEKGDVVRHEFYGGKSRVACEKAARKALQLMDTTGRYFEPLDAPMGPCLDLWLEKDVEVNLKANTVDQYRVIVDDHLKPAFGTVPLKKMTTALIQDWMNEQKKKYSKGTLKVFYSVLHGAFRWFISNRRWLMINPMADVRIPRYNEAPKGPGIFSRKDLSLIFEHFHPGTKLYIPCMISYSTGLRIGECLALTWDHIGLDTMSLKVSTTLYDKDGCPILQATPKTIGSIRVVYFGSKLKEALLQQQEWQKECRRKYRPYFLNNFVCTRENGKQLTSNDVRWFNMWCKRVLGHGSFHSFRHTHATMLLESGEFSLDYVSKRLGHSSIRTTADIYDTITPKREKAEVNKMERIL